MSTNRTRCATHQQQNPCTGCAADHLAGEHKPGTCKGTCRRCRAHRKAPLVEAATRRRPRLVPDVAALAANDHDLTEEP